MDRRRFFNPAQPQTLQIAVFLLYLDAAFRLFAMLRYHYFAALFIVLVAGGVAAAFGIANELKWSYPVAIAVSLLPFVYRFYRFGNPFGPDLLGTMFEIALVALLVHPQSRDYQRIWFK